jgi:uncharacterized protein (DUF3820 family)
MTYKTFPFGKHKGDKITDIPSTYIVYALESFDLPEELISTLQYELIERLNIPKGYIQLAVIEKVYKELAKKYHPDMGGSNSAMQAINDFKIKMVLL